MPELKKHYLEANEFLRREIIAYYALDYTGWGNPNNPNFINILKNDFNNNSDSELNDAINKAGSSIFESIKEITDIEHINTICVVPRSKKAGYYSEKQTLFLQVIKFITIRGFPQIEDGTEYIIRHTNTKTTHFHRKPEYSGDGDYPYPGITKNTCTISSQVRGKNILLIDDIYTKTINIDEDCIQALLDNGAKKVILFTVAKTTHSSDTYKTAKITQSDWENDIPF